jgi:class 3 adenylate cyclase
MRIGIHSGSVVTPKAGDITSLNFAHVIDMAAHIQKVCPPGGISVSDAAAVQIPGGAAAIGAEKAMVMETGATIWMPKTSLAPIATTE